MDRPGRQHPPGDIVSILVFVELALDDPAGRSSCSRTSDVSILVFVELALDGSQIPRQSS